VKHTTPPFRLGYDSGDTVEITALISKPGAPGTEVVIAEVVTEFEMPDGSSPMANANLFIAAPDLLAACEAAIPLLKLLAVKTDMADNVIETLTMTAAAVEKAKAST